MVIIIVSGTSSSGKSTLCNALKQKLGDAWLAFSTDIYLSMLGDKFLGLHPDNTKVTEPNPVCYAKRFPDETYEIIPGELCSTLYLTIPDTLALLASNHFNIIVDSFVTIKDEFSLYQNKLKKYGVMFVYLHATEQEIARREAARGDRLKGSAVHWLRKFNYQDQCDLVLDTSQLTFDECVATVLDKVRMY